MIGSCHVRALWSWIFWDQCKCLYRGSRVDHTLTQYLSLNYRNMEVQFYQVCIISISINTAWKNLLKSVIPKTSSNILNWIGKEQILKLYFKNYSNWIFCLYCIYGLFEWHDLIWLSQSWAIKKRKWKNGTEDCRLYMLRTLIQESIFCEPNIAYIRIFTARTNFHHSRILLCK